MRALCLNSKHLILNFDLLTGFKHLRFDLISKFIKSSESIKLFLLVVMTF